MSLTRTTRTSVAALAAALIVAAPLAVVDAGAAQASPMSGSMPMAQAPVAAVQAKGAPGTMARKYLGRPRSGLPWHSGAWTGAYMNAKNATAWGTWRGRPSDATPTYPDSSTWSTLRGSNWEISTFDGFRGVLVYGLPLLPKNSNPTELPKVAAGSQDATYRRIARDLRTRYRSGKVVVRIGWEANGNWMSFSTTYGKAKEYRAAFRRAATVIKKEFPAAVIDFDVNCGTPLRGQHNRLDSLTRLYPGDDVVDLVGCDTYDWDVLKARTEREWRGALKPRNSVGIQDVADFARQRRKGLSFPEWGITHAWDGNGDNPFYITKMKQFFDANSDVLVLENYFNVPDRHMHNSLWGRKPQNPKSGAVYRKLW